MSDSAGANQLTKSQLLRVLAFCDVCLTCEDEDDLHTAILEFGAFLGCEFVLYAYMVSAYHRGERVRLVNLSNPKPWMAEYDARRYVEVDPVRMELEHRLARGRGTDGFVWDAYERELSPAEREVIERRSFYGLRYGCSAYCNSQRQDSIFLISFASGTQPCRPDTLAMSRLVVSHLNRARKRLDLRMGVARLTRREKVVADWLLKGKSNGEIAAILGVSEHTVKFHVARIYDRLSVNSRQAAVAVLLAERFL